MNTRPYLYGWPNANAKQVSTHKKWDEAGRVDEARQKANRVVEGVQLAGLIGGHHKQVEWERVDTRASRSDSAPRVTRRGLAGETTTRKPTSREAACGTAVSITNTPS